MRPWDNNEEERDEKKGGVGNWLYDRTIGRLSRWNREAIDELHDVKTVREDGTQIPIIHNGRFVLPGCEELNRAFEEESV